MTMSTKIETTTADDLISNVWNQLRQGVEAGILPLSSESTFRFLFAWELGRLLQFAPAYRVDFEWEAYSSLDSEDTFLDLLVYTDPDFKIALEFKLPKYSDLHGSGSTQIRARICRDISRLSHLVRNTINSIRVGYFLCATDEGSYLMEGHKKVNLQYKTYHGAIYAAGAVIPEGKLPNGIARKLTFPNHEVRFEWGAIKHTGVLGTRLAPTGRFAWLKPIKISA